MIVTVTGQGNVRRYIYETEPNHAFQLLSLVASDDLLYEEVAVQDTLMSKCSITLLQKRVQLTCSYLLRGDFPSPVVLSILSVSTPNSP